MVYVENTYYRGLGWSTAATDGIAYRSLVSYTFTDLALRWNGLLGCKASHNVDEFLLHLAVVALHSVNTEDAAISYLGQCHAKVLGQHNLQAKFVVSYHLLVLYILVGEHSSIINTCKYRIHN